MLFLCRISILFCLLIISCTKESENPSSLMYAEPVTSHADTEYLRIWVNDTLLPSSYFRLRKANGASRMHLTVDLPYFSRLSLFATPIFIGSQPIYSGNEPDINKKFNRTHIEFFQHENTSIIRYYDVASSVNGNNQLYITAIDSVKRIICAEFEVRLWKSYELVGNALDSLSLRGALKLRYYD